MTADVWGRCSLGRLADSFRDLPRPSQSFRILPQSFSELFRTFSESSFSSRVAFQVQPGDRLIMLEVTMATDPETDEACVRASVALAAEVEVAVATRGATFFGDEARRERCAMSLGDFLLLLEEEQETFEGRDDFYLVQVT